VPFSGAPFRRLPARQLTGQSRTRPRRSVLRPGCRAGAVGEPRAVNVSKTAHASVAKDKKGPFALYLASTDA